MIGDSLRDQVAIVTGGSSGIGSAIVKELLSSGMRVVIVDIDKKKAEDSIQQYGTMDKVAVVELDLTHTSSLQQVTETANKRFGRIDLLVNCAGIFPSKPILLMIEDEWDHVINLNMKAPFFLSQVVARYMIEKKMTGSILNIASTAASMPRAGISHYAASKAGLVMLTRVMALEWAPYGIRVNAVCPGVVETETLKTGLQTERLQKEHEEKISKMPLSRAVLPEEVAKTVLYLADPVYSGSVMGQALHIDGGYTAGQVFTTFRPGTE